jgi:hypothetical protein
MRKEAFGSKIELSNSGIFSDDRCFVARLKSGHSEKVTGAIMRRILGFLFPGSVLFSALYRKALFRAVTGLLPARGTRWALILGAFLVETAKCDLRFTATGQLRTAFYQKGVEKSESTVPFEVSIDGSNVWIKVDRSASHQGIEYDEFRSPGTNGFSIRKYGGAGENSIARRFNPKTGKLEEVASDKPRDDATLVITSEAFPDWTKDYLTPIWVAMAGAHQFEAPNGERLFPAIYPPGEDAAARELYSREERNVLTKWAKDPAGDFLSMLVLARNGKAVTAVGGKLRVETLSGLPPRFDAAVEFRVNEWTNVLGRKFPRTFTFSRRTLAVTPNQAKESGRSAAPESLFDVVVFTGEMANFLPDVNPENFKPWIPQVARVIENRFMRAEPAMSGLDYTVTNGSILDLAELKNLTRYKMMENEARAKNSLRRKRSLMTGILLLALVFPIVISAKKLFAKTARGD